VLWSAGPPCTVWASTRLILPRNNLAVTGHVTSATTFDDSQDADHNLQDINEQHNSRAVNATRKTQSRAIGVLVARRLVGSLGIRTADARREMKNDNH
jgi:hypothetical protein